MYHLFSDPRWPRLKHKPCTLLVVGVVLLIGVLGDTRAEIEVRQMIDVTPLTSPDDLGSTVAHRDMNMNITTWLLPLELCNVTSECSQGFVCSRNFCSCPRNCRYILNKCDCGRRRLFPFWYFLIGGLLGLVVSYHCVQEIKKRSKKNQQSEPEVIFIPRRPSSDGRFRVTGDGSAIHLHTVAPSSDATDESPTTVLPSQLPPLLIKPVAPLPPIGQTLP
ncbi:uncharacterized protein [Penaeus vannamei]|uniref:uncharacterized protein n=1 Tax=Penaeus vannamei TaxID=6689 RepID=UPI00387FB17E